VAALREVTVAFVAGSFTAVMGPSGSGKSTLLQCAAGLDRPTSGEIRVAGHDLGGLSEANLTVLRRERIGLAFQSFNLLPSLTAELNVALPLRLAGRKPRRRQIRDALAAAGLENRARHCPAELSGETAAAGGDSQGASHRPEVIFADEPTGATQNDPPHLPGE
jgi:putative ABC transport system ATP-binding protein